MDGSGSESHSGGERPGQLTHGDDLTGSDLNCSEVRRSDAAFHAAAVGRELELHREPRQRMEVVAIVETRAGVETFGGLDISVDHHVLPRNKSLLEHDHRIVLIETAGEGSLEWDVRGSFVGGDDRSASFPERPSRP